MATPHELPTLTKQKIYRPAVAIKSDELPEDVLKAAEGLDVDKWYYATVETPDREKDIVRVPGIDTERYTQHGGPISLLVAHNRKPAPGGSLPIAGKVVKWVPTKHKGLGVPAMAAGVKFLATPLGNESKIQADADVLAVSIGFEPLEAQPIKGGGYDYTRAAISELSICVTGMNQFAGPVKSDDEPADGLAEALKAVSEMINRRLDEQGETLKQLKSQLDDIECEVVAKSKESAPTGDRDEQNAPDPSAEALRTIAEALKAFSAASA